MMARRRSSKRLESADIVNIDPLMDVVTCVVGIMLFVVIFAVIEARGSRVEMVTPRLQSPPAGTARHVFLCEAGRVRTFPIDGMIDRFLEEPRRLTYGRVPGLVRDFNARGLEDRYFSYRAEYETDPGVSADRRKVYVIADERSDASGEDVRDLEGGGSVFEAAIRSLVPDEAWVSFIVDPDSIDVFRSARAVAVAYGLAVGWDPGLLSFPYRSCLVGCDDVRTEGLAAGPQTR